MSSCMVFVSYIRVGRTTNEKQNVNASATGVIGSDVPWLECPACNALTWVMTVTE